MPGRCRADGWNSAPSSNIKGCPLVFHNKDTPDTTSLKFPKVINRTVPFISFALPCRKRAAFVSEGRCEFSNCSPVLTPVEAWLLPEPVQMDLGRLLQSAPFFAALPFRAILLRC